MSERITKEQLKDAIEIVDRSRQTHIVWVKHFEICPEHQRLVEDTVHSKEEQEEIIEEYTRVLDVLNKIKGYING